MLSGGDGSNLSLTFSGCSWGARSLSLFLHLSIRVNLPVFPVAWASAYTTSWKRIKVILFQFLISSFFGLLLQHHLWCPVTASWLSCYDFGINSLRFFTCHVPISRWCPCPGFVWVGRMVVMKVGATGFHSWESFHSQRSTIGIRHLLFLDFVRVMIMVSGWWHMVVKLF